MDLGLIIVAAFIVGAVAGVVVMGTIIELGDQ